MVKRSWHKAASPQQTVGSIMFARLRQCAIPREHISAIWRIRLNLGFLRSTSLQPKLQIDRLSHFCTIMAKCRRAHCRHLANVIELVLPSVHPSPQPKRQVDRLGRLYTAHCIKSLYFTIGAPFPKIVPSHTGIWTPSNL